MAIRSFFGFDDVPLPTGEQVAGSVSLPPLPFTFKPGQAVAKGGVTYSKANGWLKCTGSVDASPSGVSKNNYLFSPLTALGLAQGATAVITFGIRWFFPIPVAIAANWPHPISVVSSGSPTPTTIGIGTAFPFGSIPGWEAGKEYYLEAQYDVAAQVIRRKVDGVAIADLAMTSTTQTAITAGTAQFCAGIIALSGTIAGNIEYSFWFKDMYVLDKTGDGRADTFLGPQRVVPITVASVDQPTWPVAGAADAVSALNTPVTDVASLGDTTVTSDALSPIVNIGLDVPAFLGQVNAMSLNAAAKKTYGGSGNISGSITTGADTAPTGALNLTNVISSTGPFYTSEKTPSNVRWTRTGIKAAVLKLTTG